VSELNRPPNNLNAILIALFQLGQCHRLKIGVGALKITPNLYLNHGVVNKSYMKGTEANTKKRVNIG
jgi:hypothetical protein